ncbi:MAG: hypothetical protein C6W55_10285 [Thermobacillus sp.]|uniref:Uncharacterized protein n=1 Tax=Thermobacillus composti (strain DSM 18247 / JCM 13945 / KWC4) TaxID=717605 RepID=L0ECG5_THECK|nr:MULTISPECIES: hypothetical protein [Thermobacillus]AGA57371.1 hypothetical protein Theco_1203 [Thermobacillus composti KWC4]REK55364.1 MAG: hypothetical protein C6W55_10285 [Thermobacillus sp.]
MDLRNRKIVIHTLDEREDRAEYTDIVFEGVLCHQFGHHFPGSILLGIFEQESDRFFANEQILNLLEQGKNHGWPVMFSNITELKEKINRELYKYIEILVSYGFNGWVLAQNYSKQANPI